MTTAIVFGFILSLFACSTIAWGRLCLNRRCPRCKRIWSGLGHRSFFKYDAPIKGTPDKTCPECVWKEGK